jgi:two-component system, NarL family, sensor kinase
MREISNDLMPSTLLRKGLTFAIEEFICKISPTELDGRSITGLTINFKHSDIPNLAKEKEINIYRMVQEIVHNAIKHSKASTLEIDLRTNDQKLILSTQDNGRGFDHHSTIKESAGLGLRSLVSRSDVMDGDFYIETEAGKGTNYTIEIPLK